MLLEVIVLTVHSRFIVLRVEFLVMTLIGVPPTVPVVLVVDCERYE